MSLINDMLQDLDKRRASLPERAGVPRHVRVLPPARERRVPWKGLSSVLLALVTACAWYVYRSAPSRLHPAGAIVSAAAAAAPTESATPAIAQVPQPQRPGTSASVAQDVRSRPLSTALVVTAEHNAPASPPSRAEPVPQPAADYAPASRGRAKSEPAPMEVQRTALAGSISLRMDAMPAERTVASVPGSQSNATNAQIDRTMRELTPSQLAENEYRAGANLLNQGRVAEAQEQFAAALRHAPSHVGARQALFGLLLQAKKMTEAEQVIHEALKIDPAQPGFAMALARLQVDRGDTAAAVETLQNAVPATPSNPDYLAFLAALLQRQGRHAQAAEMYQAALALAPRSAVWLMGLGISLQALNRNSDAQAAFRRAKATDGLNGELQAFVDQRLKQLQ